MVQKKFGTPNRQRGKGPMKAAASPKTFDINDFEDDDDDDLSGSGSEDSMEVQMSPRQRGGLPRKHCGQKVTPLKASALSTPSSNKKKDMHVSFQLQNKGTPGQQKTPKGTPQQAAKLTPGPMKKQAGENQLSGFHKFFGKSEDQEDDDDEEDDSDDDFEGEEADENDDVDSDDDEGEDDEDDDDDDLDDDDDDIDLDSEEEEKLRQEVLKLTNKKTPEKGMAKKAADGVKKDQLGKAQKKETPQKKQEQPATPASTKKQPKTLVRSEPAAADNKQSPNKAQTLPPQNLVIEKQRENDRDKKMLFVRGLPTDCTIDEMKVLSADILDVTFPNPKFQKKNKKKNFFAFLEFANEKKAEENHELLQKKKLRGQALFIDFAGTKSKNRGVSTARQQEDHKLYSKKRLFITGLPSTATLLDVAQLFPKSHSILINNAPEYRNATVQYLSEEECAAAFEANSNCKIGGRVITVLYSLETRKGKKRQRKAVAAKAKGKEPAAKRMKFEPNVQPPKEEESDYDDEDDDDDDDDEE